MSDILSAADRAAIEQHWTTAAIPRGVYEYAAADIARLLASEAAWRERAERYREALEGVLERLESHGELVADGMGSAVPICCRLDARDYKAIGRARAALLHQEGADQ